MTFRDFVVTLGRDIGAVFPEGWERITDEVLLARAVLARLNRYFFQTHEGIGTLNFRGQEYLYFSEFHKYWEKHHRQIIDARVERAQALLAARALREAWRTYGDQIFAAPFDTLGLPPTAIAQVRFLTANQDFRKSLEPVKQFKKYLADDTRFDAQRIASDPASFLAFLGFTDLSQGDKRIDYARNAALFLLDRGITAYQIASYYSDDAWAIRKAFLESAGMGYGRKKTDMFLRDMFVLGVWPSLSNMQAVDVASDRNTIKIALRTRVLQTAMPLLSSFLDIFGYQYEYVDEMSSSAWRAVWEEWQRLDAASAPASPCLMDFLLYRIGREYCEDKVVEYLCAQGHVSYNFGDTLSKCRLCRSDLKVIRRLLPCQVPAEQLPRHEDGRLRLKPSNLLYTFDGKCIFETVCAPRSRGFRRLSPPRAISISGQTGWTKAYAFWEEGGGGLMS